MVGFNAQPPHWITLHKFLITLVTQFGSTCTALLWAVTSSVETLVWKITDILFLTNCAYCSLLLKQWPSTDLLNYPYLTHVQYALLHCKSTLQCVLAVTVWISLSLSVSGTSVRILRLLWTCADQRQRVRVHSGEFSHPPVFSFATFQHVYLVQLFTYLYLNYVNVM